MTEIYKCNESGASSQFIIWINEKELKMLSFYRFNSPGLPMDIGIYDRPEAEEVREDPGWDLGVWRRTNCQSSGFGINPIA